VSFRAERRAATLKGPSIKTVRSIIILSGQMAVMTRMDRSSSGPLRPYLVNQTVHWFIVGLISPVLILLVLDKELNIFEAGTVLAIHSGTAVLLSLSTGGLADSIGRREVYLISVTIHMASVILPIADIVRTVVTRAIIKENRAASGGDSISEGLRKVPLVIASSIQYGVRSRPILIQLLVMTAMGLGPISLEFLWKQRIGEIIVSDTRTWVMGVLAAACFFVTANGSAMVTSVCVRSNNDNAPSSLC
jgi:MFS family permease